MGDGAEPDVSSHLGGRVKIPKVAQPVSTLAFGFRPIAVAILATFVCVTGALISERVFERLPHIEDEVAYLFQARVFAGGQMVIDIPHHHRSFWQPFVVDYQPSGKRFGKYPPGWPAILAVGVVLGCGWLVNAVLGALTVLLVYRIGLEAYDPDVGLISAVLTAFSPAALLLNGTLMPHSAALFFATLFMWSHWRMERERPCPGWAVAAGAAIGAVFAIRPLSAIAIGLPFFLWAGVRAFADRATGRGISFRSRLLLLVLAVAVASSVACAVPLFNLVATGDARTNLYELVWPYDSIGFGEGHGRTGHTLAKGLRHARFDLSLAAADLFGWQLQPISLELVEVLRSGAGAWPATGFSFVLLPIGVLIGLTAHRGRREGLNPRIKLMAIWFTGAVCWLLLPRLQGWFGSSPGLENEPRFGWLWVVVAIVWLLLPLPALSRWRTIPQVPFTWLLVSAALGIVILHVAYWTGSQRFSTRYYFEALTAAALLSAIPLARAAVGRWRIVVYAAVVGVSVDRPGVDSRDRITQD